MFLAAAPACAGSGDGGGGGGGDDDVGGGGDGDGGTGVIDEKLLIDDLEDGDGAIHEVDGRIGAWFTFADDTMGATMTPRPGGDFVASEGGAGGSAFAARMTGKGFKTWGAGMGLDLNNPGETMGGAGLKKPWDASKYKGIAFRARGNASIKVAVVVAGVVPTDAGGTCTPSTKMGEECDDVHARTVSLSADWKEVEVPFAQLKQGGWGKKVAFDAGTATGVYFMVGQNVDFDVAIDDLRFVE
jgi:hypothetical protein